MKFELNGKTIEVDVDPQMPLLWVLRDVCGLPGTRYGCGRGLCGTCTVHLDGEAVRSCSLPVSAAADRSVTTIEGLGSGDELHPVQQAWVDADVPQCGYCQSGQIMQAVALFREDPNPSREKIDQAMSGVLCRCGTYTRIRKAINLLLVQGKRGES